MFEYKTEGTKETFVMIPKVAPDLNLKDLNRSCCGLKKRRIDLKKRRASVKEKNVSSSNVPSTRAPT